MVFKSTVKILFLGVVIHWLYSLGQFFKLGHHVHTQWPGACRQVQGIVEGSEDAEMISGDLLLISSGVCFPDARARGCLNHTGKMFLFDFSRPDEPAKEVKIDWITNNQDKARYFHPHGLSIWHGTKQPTVLVVNHALSEYVEVFTFDEKSRRLKHQESIAVPDVKVLNDVKATGPRSFYFTNFMQFAAIPVLNMMEMLARAPLGWVGHYNGESGVMQVVATQIYAPNGVQMSHDGKYVYVSNIGEQAIDVFTRHSNNSLDLIKRLELHSIADNLSLEPTNSALWVGGVPIAWQTVRYGMDHTTPCASQVLKLELKAGVPTGKIQQIYAGNNEIKGLGLSSVAVYHKSMVFIGSVRESAAVCDILYDN